MAAAGSGCGVLQLACEWSKPGPGLWHSELPFCFRKCKKLQYCDYITYDLLIFVLSLSTVHWSQGADELNASTRPSVQLFLPFSSCRQPGTLNRQVLQQTPKINLYMMLMQQSKTPLLQLFLSPEWRFFLECVPVALTPERFHVVCSLTSVTKEMWKLSLWCVHYMSQSEGWQYIIQNMHKYVDRSLRIFFEIFLCINSHLYWCNGVMCEIKCQPCLS